MPRQRLKRLPTKKPGFFFSYLHSVAVNRQLGADGFDWDTEWAEGESRESVMVFIADDLPEAKIREGFARLM